jgi:DNA-binding SARP family transcriptional activator
VNGRSFTNGLYYLTGNPTAALRQYADCVATMAAEFGIGPSPVMLALRQAIATDQLTHDPPPSVTSLPLLSNSASAAQVHA